MEEDYGEEEVKKEEPKERAWKEGFCLSCAILILENP